jgi:2'-5' RNA ligase
MRCFVAIDIDQAMKADLTDVQTQIKAQVDLRSGEVKWVRPEAMHLTLKFLGEIKNPQSVRVCDVTQAVCQRHMAFEVAVREVGFFGGRSARVVWVGVGRDSQALMDLQTDLEAELDQAGWPPEGRRFSAHLTLGRVKQYGAGRALAQGLSAFKELDLGTLPVQTVSVYQSQLRPQGPEYTALARYTLKAS